MEVRNIIIFKVTFVIRVTMLRWLLLNWWLVVYGGAVSKVLLSLPEKF
jgi:hypothetical protein